MTTNRREPQRNDSLGVDRVTTSFASLLPSPTIEVASPDEPNADPSLDRRV